MERCSHQWMKFVTNCKICLKFPQTEQGPKSSGAFTFGPQDWGMSGNPIEPGSTSADAGIVASEHWPLCTLFWCSQEISGRDGPEHGLPMLYHPVFRSTEVRLFQALFHCGCQAWAPNVLTGVLWGLIVPEGTGWVECGQDLCRHILA